MRKEKIYSNDETNKNSYIETLAHTTWECKYHIAFAPKYGRQEIYGKLNQEIGAILRELCRRKEVEIIAAEEDLIHTQIATKEYVDLFIQKSHRIYMILFE